MRPKAKQRVLYAVCVQECGYEASLEVGKLYRVVPDDEAGFHGYIRVIDESGEDYGYSVDRFFPLELPQALEKALVARPERRSGQMKREKKNTDSGKMFDGLVQIALGFLERSVDEIKDAPNYAVIDFCTAIELFLKARLLLEHWALVYGDPKLANQDKFRKGDFKSVGMTEAIARLKNISGQGINDEAKKVFEQIRDHRNRLVHFFHPDPVAVEDVTAEQCRAWFHLYPLLSRKWGSHFASSVFELALIDEKMHRNRAFLQVKYEARSKDIEQGKAKGALFLDCPSCGFEAMRKAVIAGPVVSVDCLVCRAAGPALEIECPGCGTSLMGHLYMICQCSRPITLEDVLHTYPASDNREEGEARLAYCGSLNCFEEGGWQGDVGPDETLESVVLFDGKWICLGCFALEKHTWHCSCGRRIAGKFPGARCFICEWQDGHVWPPNVRRYCEETLSCS